MYHEAMDTDLYIPDLIEEKARPSRIGNKIRSGLKYKILKAGTEAKVLQSPIIINQAYYEMSLDGMRKLLGYTNGTISKIVLFLTLG